MGDHFVPRSNTVYDGIVANTEAVLDEDIVLADHPSFDDPGFRFIVFGAAGNDAQRNNQ